jgi:hypothetical protein
VAPERLDLTKRNQKTHLVAREYCAPINDKIPFVELPKHYSDWATITTYAAMTPLYNTTTLHYHSYTLDWSCTLDTELLFT